MFYKCILLLLFRDTINNPSKDRFLTSLTKNAVTLTTTTTTTTPTTQREGS